MDFTLTEIEQLLVEFIARQVVTKAGVKCMPDLSVGNRATSDLLLAIQVLTSIKTHRKDKIINEHYRRQQTKLLSAISPEPEEAS